MIKRHAYVQNALKQLRNFEIVAILGPRQIGKTTLAKQIAKQYKGPVHHFDLEDTSDLNRLLDDPKLALQGLRGLVVIDEIQRRPDLFPLLRVLADRRPRPARFLILGSASPALLKQSSESLAGRIHYLELNGLSLQEVGVSMLNRRWLRGGFPSAYLARTHGDGFVWLESFIRTFVERDLAELGVRIPSTTMRRFWTMLAHWHAQTWNSSEFARSFGVADTTVRHYLDILSDTLVVRQLRPWHANISKRQVKAPKVYIRDSGLLHALLYIDTQKSLLSHPKLGASWEGLMIELIIDHLGLAHDNCYFWGTHTGAELDLYVPIKRKKIGFEIKRTSSPRVTPSMRSALADLNLDELIVIHAGVESYPLARKIVAVSADELTQELKRF